MIYISDKDNTTLTKDCAVSIGKFDGFHIGHQMLLDEVLSYKSKNLMPVVFTFQNGLKKRMETDSNIMTEEERIQFLMEYGIEAMVSYPFDEWMRHMTPEQFICEILHERLHARKVIVGEDFCFGYNREGNVEVLKQFASKYGYDVVVFKKRTVRGEIVASSLIREKLQAGNITVANELLGRPYSINGTVVYGNQIGSTVLGLPTANIYPREEKLLPPNGVYVVNVDTKYGTFHGVANIGYKPTIGGETRPGVETNLFDFDDDLYDSFITVHFLSYERGEKKFQGLDQLKQQMMKDKKKAIAYFLE